MKDFRVYRVTKNNTGAASKVQVVEKTKQKGDKTYSEINVFWESTVQVGVDTDGNGQFDWTKNGDDTTGKGSITLKLGMVDVGELLAVLNGRKTCIGTDPSKGIFHKTNSDCNKSMQFVMEEGKGYSFRMSEKGPGGLKQVKHTFSFSDGELLRVVLTEAVRMYYGG